MPGPCRFCLKSVIHCQIKTSVIKLRVRHHLKQEKNGCIYFLFLLVSEIDVYEFVFAKAKNLTKWMRPVRNANRPLAVKVMVLLTAIISVVTILTPLDSLNSKVLIVYILGRENWANNISRTNWFGKSINSTNIMKSNQTNSTL